MRNYLVLKEKSRAFRADPEVQEALLAARLDQLATPTMTAGEIVADGPPRELLNDHPDREVRTLMDMPRRQSTRVQSLLENGTKHR